MSEEPEIDERFTEAVQIGAALRSLKNHDGWKIFVDIVNENIHNRTQQIVLRPSSEVPDLEFMKGEATGMTTMLAFVDVKLDECESLVKALEKKDDGEEEESD